MNKKNFPPLRKENKINKDDIVQVVNEDNNWFPSLVIVSEVKSWGIQGYTYIPCKGPAFIRLDFDDIEKVGTANIIMEKKF